MPAGHHEHDRRQRDRTVFEPDRFDVAGQVIDGDQRLVERPRRRLRERHAHEQRADQAGALRHRERIDVAPRRAAVGQRALDDAADVAHVLARRQLRHHAAPFAMDVDLRGDDVRSNLPAAVRRSSTTAAAVSSQEVSIPRISIADLGFGSRINCRLPISGFVERRAIDAALGDDRGDVLCRRHVERRVAHVRAVGRELVCCRRA